MKYQYLLTLFTFLLFPNTIYSQVIGPNSQWTYSNFPFISTGPLDPLSLIADISVIGDTTINFENYFILDRNCENVDYVRYIREEGLKTYIYYNEEKLLLYDFSLGAGDTLCIAVPYIMGQSETDSIKIKIDSIEIVEVNGQELILQYVDSQIDENIADWGGRFLQGVGSLDWCLFPKYGLFEGGYSNIRCFDNGDNIDLQFFADQSCNAIFDLFPKKAKWTYRKFGQPVLATYEIIEEVNYNFNGSNYHTLAQVDASGTPLAETFVRLQMDGQKIFWLDSLEMQHLLFDFSDELEIGDTVTYELPPNANLYDISSNGGIDPIINPYQYVIEEISNLKPEIGVQRKVFEVSPLSREVDGQIIVNNIERYVSGIGGMSCLFRRGADQVIPIDQRQIERFVCYSELGFLRSFLLDPTCDLSSIENEKINSIRIYPNPTSGIINMEGEERIKEVMIYNVFGEIQKKFFNVNDNKVDLSEMETGIYFIKLTDQFNRSTFKKIYKI